MGFIVAKDMLQTSFALLLALWLSVSNLDYAETRKVHTMSISMPTSRSATSPTSSRLSLICDSTSSTCWLRFTTISGQLSTSSSSVQPAPPPPPYAYGYQPQENGSTSCSPFKFISVIVLLRSIAILF